ncbi:hypothetical protein EJP02_322 [Escherichia phage EJP2]|nr:hypothetical protein EJP02_322 [Escherichia phage EJP2]
MFNPFFNPQNMTDKELNQKIIDMSTRITNARAGGASSEIIGNMYAILDACEEENYIRYSSKEAESWRDDGACMFDLNDYLDSEEDNKKPHESSRKQIYKPGW